MKTSFALPVVPTIQESILLARLPDMSYVFDS